MPARSVRRLLILGAAIIAAGACLAILAVAAVTSRSWSRVQRQTETVLEEQANAERIVRHVQDQVMLASYYLRDPQPVLAARFRTRGEEVFQDLRQYLFRDLSGPERAEVEQMKTAHQAMEATALLVFDLVRRGETERARGLIQHMVNLSQQLQERMDRLMALRRDRIDALKAAHRRTMRELFVAMALLAGLSLLVIGLFARVLRRRMLRPLADLSAAAARLGAGDPAARVPVERPDELGAVAESFNGMADRLQDAREALEARNRQLADALDTLRRTQQEAVQTEKLTALGGMLAGLAHELSAPLATVLSHAERLHEGLAASRDEGARALGRELAVPLLEEGVRARDLVHNLLHFSRGAGGRLGPVSLDDALQAVVSLRKYSFGQAGLAIVTEVQAGLWVVADPQRLQQAFLNLINNAFDALAGGRGHTLWVRAAVADDPLWVEVVLEDDGPGLAEPARAFDPFYTTKPGGHGPGLGLSVVHRMVTDFGGSIEAGNRPEGGARFRMRLRGTADPRQRLTRILVVDDEAPVRNLQRRILAQLGVEVLTAAGGEEARELLQRERVALVVTDVKMPGLDGVALYRWAEREKPELAGRFLFVTGDPQDPLSAELAAAMPERFMAKPFQTAEYLEFVRRAME